MEEWAGHYHIVVTLVNLVQISNLPVTFSLTMVSVTDSSEPLLGHSHTAPRFIRSLQQGRLPITRGVVVALQCRLSRAEDTSNLLTGCHGK